MSVSPVAQRYRIGYALPNKKVDTFIQPSLLDHAKQNGVDLVPVDLSMPLIDQGPFHCIVHKLYVQDWNEQLKEYASKYPNTVIIDPPECIGRLQNRTSMLEVVKRLKIPQESESSFGVPKQVVVEDPEGLKNGESLGLKFPVIAKPVFASGSGSHEMYLVMNSRGLEKVRTPIVLQEFVKHGGVVFKVYVVGEQVKCAKRRSLPDDISWDWEEGVLAFSQISNSAVQEENDVNDKVEKNKAAEMPSEGFVEALARGLREELGLHLFNFDLIRETKIESESDCKANNNNNNKYLVIDINYFPGYAKMPCFQQVMTDFFLRCCDISPTQQQLQASEY